MEKVVWTDEKFSVGHKQIDAQHRFLVDTLNKLIDLQKGRFNLSQQRKILADVEGYVDRHLAYEEGVLEDKGYAHFEEHCELHTEYMMEMEVWVALLDDEDSELPGRMIKFLAHWLVDHILGEDMKFKETVAKNA